jgi:hypothetical protein
MFTVIVEYLLCLEKTITNFKFTKNNKNYFCLQLLQISRIGHVFRDPGPLDPHWTPGHLEFWRLQRIRRIGPHQLQQWKLPALSTLSGTLSKFGTPFKIYGTLSKFGNPFEIFSLFGQQSVADRFLFKLHEVIFVPAVSQDTITTS